MKEKTKKVKRRQLNVIKWQILIFWVIWDLLEDWCSFMRKDEVAWQTFVNECPTDRDSVLMWRVITSYEQIINITVFSKWKITSSR